MSAPVEGAPQLAKRLIGSRFDAPVDLQAAPGDTRRVFVVEKGGRIRIQYLGDTPGTGLFLDIGYKVSRDTEQGLLGLAFHPRYRENGRFFIHYTDRSARSHVSELHVSADPEAADATSEREVLLVARESTRHNGGRLMFGPDGKLYLSFGDGSAGGDLMNNAQNLSTRLGKILRIDVDAGTPYAVPADNPFVSRADAAPEIWAYGLRNPWRFSLDPVNGDLFIGDVGQGQREEIDFAPAAAHGGQNFGWAIMEGRLCFRPPGCHSPDLTPPLHEYTHREGCAVVGGFVYRGCRMPGYHGTYFFSDYCNPLLRSFRLEDGQLVDFRDWGRELGPGIDAVTTLGLDAEGELLIADLDGEIYRVVPAP